ncbi:hypothetical protein ABPG73_014196 [Tetrahymena malaccensis]
MNFRRIDLFSSKFNFNADENFIQKGTYLGSIYTIIVVCLVLSYFFYIFIQYANNQIEPVYRSQNIINNSTQEIHLKQNIFAYKINYRFLDSLQYAGYVQFQINGIFSNGTSLFSVPFSSQQCSDNNILDYNCVNFDQQIDESIQQPIQEYNYILSQVTFQVISCNDDLFSDIPKNCANQTDIDEFMNNIFIQFKLQVKQYNIQSRSMDSTYQTPIEKKIQESNLKGLIDKIQISKYENECIKQENKETEEANKDESVFIEQIDLKQKIKKMILNNNKNDDQQLPQNFFESHYIGPKLSYSVKYQECQDQNNNTLNISLQKQKQLNVSIDKQISNANQLQKSYAERLKISLSKAITSKLQNIIFNSMVFNKKKYLHSIGFQDQFKSKMIQQIDQDLNIARFYQDLIFLKKAVMILLTQDQLATLQLIGCSQNFLNLNLDQLDAETSIIESIKTLNHYEQQLAITQSQNLKYFYTQQFLQRCSGSDGIQNVKNNKLMSKDKKYSFIRYFDIFAPPYYQKINQDHYKKRTVIGGLFSILIFLACLSYFIQQITYLQLNKITPKFMQYDEFQAEEVEYTLPSKSLSVSIFQLDKNLIQIEMEKKIQYFNIYLIQSSNNQIINSFTSFSDGIYAFGDVNQYQHLELKRYTRPFSGNNIQVIISSCSQDFLRAKYERCATQEEVYNLLEQYELVLILTVYDQSFSIKGDQLNDRLFTTMSLFNNQQKTLGNAILKVQQTEIQKGLFIQSSTFYKQICNLNFQSLQSRIYQYDISYAEIAIQLDNEVKQTKIQYPQFPEILAQVWGVASLLLLSGYVFQFIAQATLAQDFLAIQLKYYYKKTALKVFGKDDIIKQNQNHQDSYQQAEAIIKQNEELQNTRFKKNFKQYFKISKYQKWAIFFLPKWCLKRKKKMSENQLLLNKLIKQTNKDMCVFEMQKEFLKLRTAIKFLLTPEQYSAIQMCGCDLDDTEQALDVELKEQNIQKETITNQIQDQNEKDSNLSVSDIQNPINSHEIQVIQFSSQSALNHLEIMNKVDFDIKFRQDCLQKFLNEIQINQNKEQQLINERIVNSMIGVQFNSSKSLIQDNYNLTS